jgi:hypothetical protein
MSNSESSSPIPTGQQLKPLNEGRINEKERSYERVELSETGEESTGFNPEVETSHLVQAIVGLDRYPNYLMRWNDNIDDVQKLESALEKQLEKVRLQRKKLLERNRLASNIVKGLGDIDSDHQVDTSVLNEPADWSDLNDVLDSRASRAIFQSKMFQQKDRPSLQDVLKGKIDIELDASKLEEWLDEEAFDTYSFPLLSKEFCCKVKKVAKALMKDLQEKDTIIRPLDMDSIGASWITNLIFHLIIRPLSKHLFHKTESWAGLDWRQGYIAGYSADFQRTRLVPHTDDSEVTLNIGMGDEDFQGGDLIFWGLRGTKAEGRRSGDFHPEIGKAIMHAGRQLHEVSDVTDGNRFVFIIWARSWRGIRRVTCPCCWLHRRQKSIDDKKATCIFSPRWN